ncbi:MAG: anti-sigma factor [Vulcanimicrobiaceae bacterium]
MTTMSHDDLFDNIAVYAAHLQTCAQCRKEYEALGGTPAAFATTQHADAGPMLKTRTMREARRTTASSQPAYLVAAACFVIALISGIATISLTGQVRQAQTQVAMLQRHTLGLTRSLAAQRSMLADLVSNTAQHYRVADGEVVRSGPHLYIAMHNMPMPRKGHVYQVWTLAKGSAKMHPSVTFVPDRRGVVVVALPGNAQKAVEVAVSVEPAGGSKQPTTRPVMVVALN